MDKHTDGEVTQAKDRMTFKKMNGRQKGIFILKLVVCIFTFGMAFPNLMSD